MNFRIYASGVLLILVYQIALAAVPIRFVAHCEMENGATGPERGAAAATVSENR